MRRMRSKYPRTSKRIAPTQKELDRAREIIVNKYKTFPKYKDDTVLFAKAEALIQKAREGWPGAHTSFLKRIKFLTQSYKKKAEPVSFSQGRAKKGRAKDIELVEEIKKLMNEQEQENSSSSGKKTNDDNNSNKTFDTLGEEQLFKNLDDESRKFVIERKFIYKNEFELNSSSDQTLLMELLCDELTMKKIREMEFAEMFKDKPSPAALASISKMADASHARLQVSMKNLGITRDQRKDELNKKVGDIASIAINLDRKKKIQLKVDEVWSKEELEGLERKARRGDVFFVEGLPRPIHDQIPEMTEIDEILEESGISDSLREDLE